MNMKSNNYKLFALVVMIAFLITLLLKFGLSFDKLVYNFYSEQLAQEQLENLLKSQQKWAWVGYVILPLLILIRSSLVALCLSIGLFFYDLENNIKFKQLFRVALLGEFVLVMVGYVKLFYFYFLKTDYTLQELQGFYPLSYINFIDTTKIEPWLVYPLQTINLFEIGYFFVLVYGLHKVVQNKYLKSVEIVAVSYGTGLLIWMGLMMFLTLNLT